MARSKNTEPEAEAEAENAELVEALVEAIEASPAVEDPQAPEDPAEGPALPDRWIRILYNYGGALTQERRIEPGDYVYGDPALFGAEDYLLSVGVAEEL